jgi:hypothetical protein
MGVAAGWLLFSGCLSLRMGSRVDLQKRLSRNMRLAIGSANRSSVQEVRAPRAGNVTLGGRVPNAYPVDPTAP